MSAEHEGRQIGVVCRTEQRLNCAVAQAEAVRLGQAQLPQGKRIAVGEVEQRRDLHDAPATHEEQNNNKDERKSGHGESLYVPHGRMKGAKKTPPT